MLKIYRAVKSPFGDTSLRQIFQYFVLTRGFILLTFITIPFMVPQQVGEYQMVSVNKEMTVRSALIQSVATADAKWYANIGEQGYRNQSYDKTIMHYGFFPLYPFLIRILHGDFYLTGLVVSNLLFLVCLISLYKTAQLFGLDEKEAISAVFYLSIFPASYFFSMPLTESLFLCLTLGSVYAAKLDRWWLAGFIGALSTATRVTGILLFPLLIVLYWQEKRIRYDALGILLVPLGLIAFMSYVWMISGDPFNVIHSQSVTGRNTNAVFFLKPLINLILHPTVFSGWGCDPLSFAIAVFVLFCVYYLAREKQWALALYCLLSVAMPLSTDSLMSVPRYMAVVYPIYLVLAKIGYERVVTLISVALLAWLTLLCALHYTFAVA